MVSCKYCNKTFKTASGNGVHEIQCKLNPNFRVIQQGRKAWNKGLTATIDNRVAELASTIRKSRMLNPFKMTLAQKEHLSKHAKLNGYGGYRENAGRSKKFKVYDSFGNQTTLQSTYEYACFEILCELEIRWIRPKALKYDNKNYFADFYLVDFDIWLDPKNSYKALQDANKIQKVIEQNNIKLFVLLKEQITKQYISFVIQ